MAGTRKTAAKKTAKAEPFVWFEESTGFYYIVDGKKKENVGISKRYADRLLAERNA